MSINGLINGALGLVGNVLQRNWEESQADKERAWNEAMMDKQNDWNLNMWTLENEYNSPEKQVDRYLAAGLNPMGIGLGDSNANALESAQPNPYQRASMSTANNPIQAGIDAYVQQAQLENIRANTAKQSQETS